MIPESKYITLGRNTGRCGEQAVTVESVEKHHGADAVTAINTWRHGKNKTCALLPSGITGLFVTDYLEWADCKATIEDIRRIDEHIDNNLLMLFDGVNAGAEAEEMVAQTFHASVLNYEECGEAFSVRGGGVLVSSCRSHNNVMYLLSGIISSISYRR